MDERDLSSDGPIGVMGLLVGEDHDPVVALVVPVESSEGGRTVTNPADPLTDRLDVPEHGTSGRDIPPLTVRRVEHHVAVGLLAGQGGTEQRTDLVPHDL